MVQGSQIHRIELRYPIVRFIDEVRTNPITDYKFSLHEYDVAHLIDAQLMCLATNGLSSI